MRLPFGEGDPDAVPAGGSGADLRCAAERGDPFPDADVAEAASGDVGDGVAVVRDLELDLVPEPGDHAGLGRGRVASHVRQRLLRDAEQVARLHGAHRLGEPGIADQFVADAQPVAARLLREGRERLDGARPALVLGDVAQRAEHAAQLGHRLAGHVLDLLHRLRGELGPGGHGASGGRGLDADQGDVVGDRVVQVARDAQPLGDDGLLG